MEKRKLAILEKAFEAEINIDSPIRIITTKSKLAQNLCADGYLQKETARIGGRVPVIISGYSLTHLGRITFCESCHDLEEVEPIEVNLPPLFDSQGTPGPRPNKVTLKSVESSSKALKG